MTSQYKNKTIQEEIAIWKTNEAAKAEAAKIRFNNKAVRQANIAARKAERENIGIAAGSQMKLF